jgi:uncharacterized membrane protein YfcA
MGILVLVALAGFAASLVDGALGMGFGPTSSTILLGAGLTPAAVSATVNIAKVATGAAGGVAHWRFGNVDRSLVLRLAVPGCVGAAVGVTVLANVDGDRLRPYLAVLLILAGLRILVRFGRTSQGSSSANPEPTDDVGSAAPAGSYDRRYIGLAALVGGVTNGLIGAWGPVVTPVLLSRKGLAPRVAIGSVNMAEIAVALTASGSLLASLGGAGVDAGKLVAMLVGGVLAAPLAAWCVRHLEPRLLGIGAGGLLLITNVRELAGSANVGPARWAVYLVVVVATAALVWRTRQATMERQADAAAAA